MYDIIYTVTVTVYIKNDFEKYKFVFEFPYVLHTNDNYIAD